MKLILYYNNLMNVSPLTFVLLFTGVARAELLCNWQSVRPSVRLGREPLCDSWPDFCWSQTVTELMSWGVFP